MKRVLVVGGAGYIGGSVTDLLAEQGLPFTVYDRLLYEHQYLKPAEFVFGDVRDTEKLGPLLANHTHVVWLAAIVGDAACQVRPDLTRAINQDAVQWLAGHFEGRIVFTSTCSVYGRNESLVDEGSALCPLSLYAQTKAAAEKYLVEKDCLIFRLGTAFGVSDEHSRLRMDLAVNYMTANAVKHGRLSVYGGAQWRPLMHVRDIARAVVAGLDAPVRGIYNMAAFNLQIRDVAEEIRTVTDCAVDFIEQRFQDQRNYHTSTKKAEASRLVPDALRTIAHGSRQIYDLVQSGRVKYTERDVYYNERHIASLSENGELN